VLFRRAPVFKFAIIPPNIRLAPQSLLGSVPAVDHEI